MSGQRITRKRIIKTCKYCYDHKLKCDKAHPCSTCVTLKTTEQCVYGFSKDQINGETLKTTARKLSIGTTHGIRRRGRNSTVYKSKFSYPFFTSIINEKILSTDHYDKSSLSKVFTRNEIHKFNRSISPLQEIEDVLTLLPESEATALSYVDTYFDWIHPIIPIFSRDKVSNSFTDVYESLRSGRMINADNALVVMAVFFCSSYSAVASGIIPDLLLCNRYYKAFRLLLDIVEFPYKSQLESLQAFTVVNFVIDPNMVDATAHSSMLVRMGQELGLHKKLNTSTIECQLTWNLLLYIEGSSSVVRGFPFSTSSSLMDAVPLPDVRENVGQDLPVSYAAGRCKINRILREVMELTSLEIVPQDRLNSTEAEIKKLYDDICAIKLSLKEKFPAYGTFFSSTLTVFLYRLHLRFFTLSSLQFEEDKLVHKTSKQLISFDTIDVAIVLGPKQNLKEEIIQLSLLLLFHTYKRLVQTDIEKFIWYTRGSTVMQYLFVIIKDLYHSPYKAVRYDDFPKLVRQTIDGDMKDIIDKSPELFKYALVEGLLVLIESKLAALWSNEDLYKFFLVQKLKEKVWMVNSRVLEDNKELLAALKCRTFFAVGADHILNMKSINIEDCMKGWESDVIPSSIDQILTSWLIDLQN